VSSIWERPERAARGPKPAHSRAEIAAVAVRLADAEGLDAVSMRRIAAALGTGTTSLYRYVSRKDDLFELMLDAVAAEAERLPPGPDARADLRAVAHRMRDTLLRHPWMPRLATQRALFTPNGLIAMEHLLSAVASAGLSADQTLIAIGTLSAYVDGAVSAALAERAADERTGQDVEQWMAAHAGSGPEIIGDPRFPALARIMVEARLPHRPDRLAAQFEAGLDCVITGILAQSGGSAG
jgi:AcrR family transcriptional regulator